jgi:hypothetical protein
MRPRDLVLPVILTVFSPTATSPQSTNYSSVEVPAGGSVRLGNYGGVRRDCTFDPLPAIEVANPPKHGVVTVRADTVRTNKVASCPNLAVPVQAVSYHAQAGYVGSDQIVFGVKRSNGVVDVYSISVTVKEAPASQGPPPSNL